MNLFVLRLAGRYYSCRPDAEGLKAGPELGHNQFDLAKILQALIMGRY